MEKNKRWLNSLDLGQVLRERIRASGMSSLEVAVATGLHEELLGRMMVGCGIGIVAEFFRVLDACGVEITMRSTRTRKRVE